jgi:hypothetical protein
MPTTSGLAPDGCCILQVGSAVHVDGIRTWLSERPRPDLRLAVSETRTFDRGVLVLLRRQDHESAC